VTIDVHATTPALLAGVTEEGRDMSVQGTPQGSDESAEQHHHTQVDDHRAVTEEEIVAAMSVNSVPDEIRVASDSQDETGQIMDGEGNVRQPVAGQGADGA
jgi:hypothetical protein